MRKPVKCKNRFGEEFEEHTRIGSQESEMNVRVDAKLFIVHRAIIGCISKDRHSFAFPWTRIICITVSFLQITE